MLVAQVVRWHQVEFAIEARAVPFMSISSDVQIYSRLEEITGTRRDFEDETDIDEGGLCDDDGLEGNGERDEGARTDDLVAAREEEPKDTGDSDRSACSALALELTCYHVAQCGVTHRLSMVHGLDHWGCWINGAFNCFQLLCLNW